MPVIERKGSQSSQGFGEFAKTGAANYIEDVFQTWLYTGNGSTQTITNGIDLSTYGGLVWTKRRNTTGSNWLNDTTRGISRYIASDLTDAQLGPDSNSISSVSSTGYSVGLYSGWNASGSTYVSWTFRKQPKFFDIVTYTGDGSGLGQFINHSLGSAPGFIVVKRTSGTSNWVTWHRGVPGAVTGKLNLTVAFDNTGWVEGNAGSPSTRFLVAGTTSADPDHMNVLGQSYVAYLFAHNAGGFGATGTDNVISCGSFTTDGSGVATVNLGYEPQFVLVKATTTSGNWILLDNMRGFVASPNGPGCVALFPNTSGGQDTNWPNYVTSTGFDVNGIIGTSQTGIYIAIRRGPMKTPTSGTSVFEPVARTSTSPNLFNTALSYVDMSMNRARATAGANTIVGDRVRGQAYSLTASTGAESSVTTNQLSYAYNSQVNPYLWTGGVSEVDWLFRRAPGFFDVVCYTGTGSARTVTHNLGVAPEMMIIKSRSSGGRPWFVYHSGMVYSPYGADDYYAQLNTGGGLTYSTTAWNSTYPTSTVFSVGAGVDTNQSGENLVAYLFATCPGVSKVGSYTGTGSTLQINCGFTGGARFVLIKQLTGATGPWAVWDSARGIVAGNDPYLRLDTTDVEVTTTDWVDAYSLGFELSPSYNAFNVNTELYIYLAIA